MCMKDAVKELQTRVAQLQVLAIQQAGRLEKLEAVVRELCKDGTIDKQTASLMRKQCE